ncbi:glutathione S-transferase family protein [Solimicrobium silvestre]|nr:glutathione S-transferase family protein [Solimicrobium silvestre]
MDAEVSSVLEYARRAELILVIGNKNYSSWSMRPWVVLVAFDIPFKEIRILLDQPDTTSRIAEYSLAGRVPVLIDGDLTVWDSLAICEYLAEQYADKKLWPHNVAARASARSICAEMHGSFNALRAAMPMDIRSRHPGEGRTPHAQADIGRITEIWEECLSKYGHHQFLFGEFSIADAYFAPVVMRFHSYDVVLAPALQAYMERVIAHPAVARWILEAKAEIESLPDHQ